MYNMGISDWIQVVAIIVSLLVGTVSIVISVISNKIAKSAAVRTANATEQSARGYISFTLESFNTGSINLTYYVVIKNYGNSSAIMNSINYDSTLDRYTNTEYDWKSGMELASKAIIYPGQVIYFPISLNQIPKSEFTITYKYTTLGKEYTEHAPINFSIIKRCDKSRFAGEPEKSSAYALQEIAERMAVK